MLCEINQSVKDKYRKISQTKQMNIWEGEKREKETNHKRLLMIEKELRDDGGRWVGDGVDG